MFTIQLHECRCHAHAPRKSLFFVTLRAVLALAGTVAAGNVSAQLNRAIETAGRQPGVIEGEFVSADGKPMPGVTVELSGGTNAAGKSDQQGRFRLEAVQPGTYEIVVANDERSRMRITDVVVQPNTLTTLNAQSLPATGTVRDAETKPAPRVRGAYTMTRQASIPLEKAANVDAAPSERPIELSPFVVSTNNDSGWLAGNTMLASRTNQPLKDTPVTIEALTTEFLLDVGAFDAMSAAEWIANATVSTENSGVGSTLNPTGTEPPPDTNRFAFRGIPNEGGPTRNLFRWYVPSDTYNVERIDFGRGSNTLLFGDSEPGGQGNIYTKRATIGRTYGNALAQIGSYDTHRFNFDYNRSFGDKFAARINLTQSHSEREVDYNKFDFKAMHGAVTYRPFHHTIIRVEGEAGDYSRNWGTNVTRISERPTAGLGFGGARYTVLPQRNNQIIDNTTLPAIDRQSTPAGATLSLLDRDAGGFPRHYNWLGPEGDQDRTYTTVSGYLEQRIGPVGLELAYNQQIAWWNENLTRGSHLMRTDGLGRRYVEYVLQDRTTENQLATYRGLATYDWKPVKWMSQFLVASAELREADSWVVLYDERNARIVSSGPIPATSSRVFYRVYVDEPGAYSPENFQRRTIPESPTYKAVKFNGSGQGGGADWARSYALSSSGTYFGGKLQSTLGARYDSNNWRLSSNAWLGRNLLPDGQRLGKSEGGTYDEHPERYTPLASSVKGGQTSWTAGLVYRLNPNINVYSVYSTSFREANGNAVKWDGDPIGQQYGKTWEVGLKSDFFDRKMVWNLNYYKLERSNVEFIWDNNLGLNDDTLEDLVNPNGLDPLSPNYINVLGRRDERIQYSKGVESTLVFFPGHGFNVRVSGAHKQVTQDKSMGRFKQLLEEAIARGDENPAYINAARNIIAQFGTDGREVAARYAAPFSFNFAVDYRFSRASKLKGLSMGLNGTYASEYILNYIDNAPIEGGKQFAMHASAGYRAKLFDRPVTLRLNVRNAFFQTHYQTTGVVKLINGSLRNIHSYGTPRTYLLTATYDF